MAEWGALLRRCSGKPDRGFKSLPLRQPMRYLCCLGRKQVAATMVAITQQPIVTQPTEAYTRRQVVAIIREVWPDEHEENALLVARRESQYVPSVVGGARNCCYGLFQMYWSVHRSWLAKSGITEPSQLLDPRANAEAALALFRRNGNSWRPWWTSSWRP